jgi:hypothetical protein
MVSSALATHDGSVIAAAMARAAAPRMNARMIFFSSRSR